MAEATARTYGTLKIEALPDGREYETALEPYLEQMKAEPGPNAPPEQYEEYFLNLRDGVHAEQFYERRLIAVIAEKLRKKIRKRCTQKFTQLVTVVSLRPAATLLAADVLQPQRAVLLYTDDNSTVRGLAAI